MCSTKLTLLNKRTEKEDFSLLSSSFFLLPSSFQGKMILSHEFNNFFSLNKTRTHLTPTSSSTYLYIHRHNSLSISNPPNLNNSPLALITKTPNSFSFNFSSILTKCSRTQISSIDRSRSLEPKLTNEAKTQEKSFWGAVTLIIGTAVGPGMLGLPSATIKSGPLPSTIAIILSWVYVISSILLVAELSFAAMEENGVGEVSFTGLAKTALGGWMGILVAIIYACLSFSLLIACVSGIGSIINQWFPLMNPVIAHVLFPCFAGILIGFFPFKAIDGTNRLLCLLMLFSITALIATGLSIGRTHLLSSFGYASWGLSAILPAIPVTVLTLGFHVITPFVCKIVGNSVFDARNAVLFGGSVPLVMVLSWNLVVLGLSQTKKASSQDPIALLLSVSSSALPAVQGFAFAALSTSLIGYAVSFPKQLVDTFELIWKETNLKSLKCSSIGSSNEKNRTGKVGFTVYSKKGCNRGSPGEISFIGSRRSSSDSGDNIQVSSSGGFGSVNIFVMLVVLGVPTVIASFFPSAFSKSLDFAGVYANCFLFGILPPIMAWVHRSRRKTRSSTDVHLLPGGNTVLLLLFAIALILGIWH